MNFKQDLFKVILKLGIHLLTKEEQNIKNYNNYLIGGRRKVIISNIDMTLLTIYNLFIFVQALVKNNGKVLFVDKYWKSSEILKIVAKRNLQYFITDKLWVGGTITNFDQTKWYYYLHNMDVGSRPPSLIVVFDHYWYRNILEETNLKKVPVVGSLTFTDIDDMLNYFVVGNFTTWNSIFFLGKVLDLAMTTGRLNKTKKFMWEAEKFKSRRDMTLGMSNNAELSFKKRWKLRKRDRFIRLFRKQVVRVRVFRPLLKTSARRKQIIEKLFSSYYNFSTKLINKTRFRIEKIKKKNHRSTNTVQNFISFYERRLISVLYRFRFCKTREVAKKIINKKLVSVNNIPVWNKNFLIKNGDVIQINALEFRFKETKSFLTRWRKFSRNLYRKKKHYRIKTAKLSYRVNRKKARIKNRKRLSSIKRLQDIKKGMPLHRLSDKVANKKWLSRSKLSSKIHLFAIEKKKLLAGIAAILSAYTKLKFNNFKCVKLFFSQSFSKLFFWRRFIYMKQKLIALNIRMIKISKISLLKSDSFDKVNFRNLNSDYNPVLRRYRKYLRRKTHTWKRIRKLFKCKRLSLPRRKLKSYAKNVALLNNLTSKHYSNKQGKYLNSLYHLKRKQMKLRGILVKRQYLRNGPTDSPSNSFFKAFFRKKKKGSLLKLLFLTKKNSYLKDSLASSDKNTYNKFINKFRISYFLRFGKTKFMEFLRRERLDALAQPGAKRYPYNWKSKMFRKILHYKKNKHKYKGKIGIQRFLPRFLLKKRKKKKPWWVRKHRRKVLKARRIKVYKFKKKKKNYPRNFLLDRKTGVALYLYTPPVEKLLLGRYITLKRLKSIIA